MGTREAEERGQGEETADDQEGKTEPRTQWTSRKCGFIPWEMWFHCLGWEDPPEQEMAIHFSILAWEIPWTEEPGGL